MVQSIDIWYVASPSEPLPDCSYDAPGVKTGSAPWVTSWNKDRKFQNSSSMKLEGLDF